MKNTIKILSLMLILSAFISCKKTPIISFEEPQPTNKSSLSKIPKSLIGNYFDYDNEALLTISETKIIQNITLKDTINSKELSDFENIKNDTYFNSITKDHYKIKQI